MSHNGRVIQLLEEIKAALVVASELPKRNYVEPQRFWRYDDMLGVAQDYPLTQMHYAVNCFAHGNCYATEEDALQYGAMIKLLGKLRDLPEVIGPNFTTQQNVMAIISDKEAAVLSRGWPKLLNPREVTLCGHS